MFEVNDIVRYGTTGVCKISDISYRNFNGRTVAYYVLNPVHQSDLTIYVPQENPMLVKKMMKLLSAEEIDALLDETSSFSVQWIDNDKLRQETFAQILSSGDRKQLIGLVRTLHLHREQLRQCNKKLHLVDARFMREAEKLIDDEFSVALHIETEQVPAYIAKKVKGAQDKLPVDAGS